MKSPADRLAEAANDLLSRLDEAWENDEIASIHWLEAERLEVALKDYERNAVHDRALERSRQLKLRMIDPALWAD